MIIKNTVYQGRHDIIKYFLCLLFVPLFLFITVLIIGKNAEAADHPSKSPVRTPNTSMGRVEQTGYRSNSPQEPRKTWAERIEQPGLPNLHKVSDALYRGAQPTAQGFLVLKQMGIKTVINLRSAHSDSKLLKGASLNYIEIPCNTWNVEESDIIAFLKAATDPSNQPVFVHCEHGADRTGTMCAIYRVIVQGWSREEAADEMVNGGYGFHSIWKNLVRLILSLDVERIKILSGLN